MSVRPRHIAISLGNIGTLQDGLGEFALQMGQRVAREAPIWRERDGVFFHFHLREQLVGLFGNEVSYVPVKRWHRWRHVQPQYFDVWHSLHQLNKNLPPTRCGARLVTVHDLNYLVDKQGFARWRSHRRALAMMRRTDHVIAISQYSAADVRKHLGWTGPLDVILRGARDFSRTPQAPLPGWAPEDSRPFLFHLSRMSASKNPQALVGLAKSWPEMNFVFSGPPSDEARHLRETVRLPNVQFHLGISDEQKAWAYARCQGFLFPSFAEGFGLPPVEAMQFGRPVFLSRLTSLPEIGGEIADYFDDFAPLAMRRVIESGLARGAAPNRQEEIRARAMMFNSDTVAGDYMALYRRLVGLGRA